MNAKLTASKKLRKKKSFLSIPGMRASIRKGMATPLSKTFKKPGW